MNVVSIPDYDIVLWDGLWIKGNLFISEEEGEFRCLGDKELVEAIKVTAYPDCVAKASSSSVKPPTSSCTETRSLQSSWEWLRGG